jgi:UDP-2-acetamido-3-amino-2,3-dideoxy-glucuronate N-acetyltransferase
MIEKNIAIVGCGLWGRNLVRNFYSLGALNTVCDLDPDNITTVKSQYNDVNTTNDLNELLKNPDIKAIAVATPSHTHYSLVKLILDAGKHVYVEKPIATRADEAAELNKMAEEKGLVLMVGHLLLYHPAVNRLRMLVKEGVLGEIRYVQSDRLNVNYLKNDRSVMWDLAPHDVSMIGYVIDKLPLSIKSAVGCSSDNNGIMDIVHLDIIFEDEVLAHVSDSWITPAKHVTLLVRGTKATAILDDKMSENKLVVYDNFTPDKKTVDYPDYLEIEPLKLECQHFLNCIKNKMKPRSDGFNGYYVVKILEEAEKIMLGGACDVLNNIQFAASRSKANIS